MLDLDSIRCNVMKSSIYKCNLNVHTLPNGLVNNEHYILLRCKLKYNVLPFSPVSVCSSSNFILNQWQKRIRSCDLKSHVRSCDFTSLNTFISLVQMDMEQYKHFKKISFWRQNKRELVITGYKATTSNFRGHQKNEHFILIPKVYKGCP